MNLQTDTLAVRMQVPTKSLTKRSLLSAVNSVYDPLGIVAPCTIYAKLIFQEECRRRIGWDEEMIEENKLSWQAW